MKKVFFVIVLLVLTGCADDINGYFDFYDDNNDTDDPVLDCNWSESSNTAPTFVSWETIGSGTLKTPTACERENWFDEESGARHAEVVWCCALFPEAEYPLDITHLKWFIHFLNSSETEFEWEIIDSVYENPECKDECMD